MDSQETRHIAAIIEQLMKSIVQRLGQLDPVFEGLVIHGVGSFWSGTRVGSYAHEFDQFFELNEDALEVKLEPDGTKVYVNGKNKKWMEAKYEDQYIATEVSPGKYLIDPDLLYNQFLVLLDQTLGEMELPSDLTYGGVLSPDYSGMRKNIPAITTSFLYQHREPPLTVDLVLGAKIAMTELNLEQREVIQTFEKLCGFEAQNIHVTTSLKTRWSLTTSVLDTMIFNTLGPSSIEIQVTRDLKNISSKILTWDSFPELSDDINTTGNLPSYLFSE